MASPQEHAIPVWRVNEPYIQLECSLGEGPYFEDKTRTLRFVDIIGKKLHRFHVDSGVSSLESYDTGDAIGVTADIASKDTHVVAAAKFGFALMDWQTGKLDYVARTYDDYEKAQRMRSNDGAIDPVGRFLAGTMTDPTLHKVETEGTLFRLERSGSDYVVRAVITPITIPNGLGWSADGRTMYHTDSPTYTIWAWDYDVTTGSAANRRAWFVVQHATSMTQAGAEEDADATAHLAGNKPMMHDDLPLAACPPGSEPDGFAIDENGDVWTAVYGAGKVLRVHEIPGQGAAVTGVVMLPAANITCPRFVDEDLIVTSAQGGGKFGGCVFRVNVGVRGQSIRPWDPVA